MMKGLNSLNLLLFPLFVLVSCQVNTKKERLPDNNKKEIEDVIKKDSNVKLTSVSDNIIGVVVLREDYKEGLLNIFNEDGSKWKSFEYTDTFSDNNIQPYALKPENILLVFRCFGKKNQFYSIVVNESNNEIKYIKQSDSFFKFETWEQHLLTVFSVGFDNKQNPIKLEPTENAKQLQFNKEEFYHPVKVNGSWLMIRDDNEKEGWIKWRDDKGKLILSLYYDA